MKYTNPIIKGFYPDPSVCWAEGSFYLVASSFQYFPGVPIFKSEDLVNWTQTGHVLTGHDQVELDKVRSSGGVFAPTIRYNDGRFYMVTNNNSTCKNFYVYTEDINGEWSKPIEVDQDGIDPSLLFDEGHVYFISNGEDENGVNGVRQCEIDIETGEKLTESRLIWTGSGGRYIESPHMYRIGDYYYLMVAEGGTEYGHMVTYARSKNVWGPFEDYTGNPVLTNRNKAPYIIQGIGHGDLIQNNDGNWYIISLGFRQIHEWQPYHHLGREVFLTPVRFDEEGWFTAGNDGTTEYEYEIPGDFEQREKREYTFENTNWDIDWCFMRKADPDNYQLDDGKAVLKGSKLTLEDVDSPTFIALRQRDFDMELRCKISLEETDFATIGEDSGFEAGITVYMDEQQHYDLCIYKAGENVQARLKLNIGDVKHVQVAETLEDKTGTTEVNTGTTEQQGKDKKCEAELIIRSDSLKYSFYVKTEGEEKLLGTAQSRYLSSEVASGFTGVMLGLYAIGEGKACFTDYNLKYL